MFIYGVIYQNIPLLIYSVDSVMLLEEGFEVQSADISDKMLKQAYQTRWNRRREDIFDRWGKNLKYFTFSDIFRDI